MDEALSPLRDPSAFRRFRHGMRYPLRGLRTVISDPSLWPFLLAPMLITATVLATAVVASFTAVPMVLGLLWTPPASTPLWIVILWAMLRYGVAAAVVMVCAALTYFCAGLIAVPFNDRLSNAVEERVLGRVLDESDEKFWADLRRSILHSLLGLALWFAVMLSLLALNIFPGVGSILEIVGSVMASGFFLSRETMDGCMSRRQLGFKHKLRVVRSNLALIEGFGLLGAMMMWIPLFNFFILPMLVVGGTLMYCDLERSQLVPNEDGTGPYQDPRRRAAPETHHV